MKKIYCYLKFLACLSIFLLFVSCKEDEVIMPSELENIKLLFPRGGENFTTNDTIPIIWEINSTELLKIDFSSDLGNHWVEIADSLESKINLFSWKTPNLISANCLIKISTLSAYDSIAVPFSINIPEYKIRYLKYYPLEIGNQWVYKETSSFNPDTYYYITIVGDTVINQRLYFILENEIYNSKYFIYEILDTLSGDVLRYEGNSMRVIDNLYSDVGEKTACIRYIGSRDSTLFESEEIFNLWETTRVIRTYFNDGWTNTYRYNLVYGIGLFASYRVYNLGGINTDTLKACIINGIVYGDSTLLK